jgi:hypothetical protein
VSRNFLYLLGDNDSIRYLGEVTDERRNARGNGRYADGWEDCRLFRWRGGIWVTAACHDPFDNNREARQYYPGGTATHIRMARLDLKKLQLVDIYQFEQIHPEKERNWLPIVKKVERDGNPHEQLQFLWGWSPFLIVTPQLADITPFNPPPRAYTDKTRLKMLFEKADIPITPLEREDFPQVYHLEYQRGSCAPLEYQDGYLVLSSDKYRESHKDFMRHRFLWLDRGWVVQKSSFNFYFRCRRIEMALGWCWSPDQHHLLISYSTLDCNSYLAKVPIAEVGKALWALPQI